MQTEDFQWCHAQNLCSINNHTCTYLMIKITTACPHIYNLCTYETGFPSSKQTPILTMTTDRWGLRTEYICVFLFTSSAFLFLYRLDFELFECKMLPLYGGNFNKPIGYVNGTYETTTLHKNIFLNSSVFCFCFCFSFLHELTSLQFYFI